MGLILITMVWRIWLIVTIFLFLNSMTTWLFRPTNKTLKYFFMSLPFIAVWPLAVFSPNGRKIIFRKIKGA